MNPVIIVFLAVAVLNIVVARPLIARKIAPNPWYGIRLPAAFVSKENWYSLNEYGGRLLRSTGIVIGLVGLAGLFFYRPPWWPVYDVFAGIVVAGTLIWMIVRCYGAAKKLPPGPVDRSLMD
jgi:hypothetical protein